MSVVDSAIRDVTENRSGLLKELCELVSVQSISAVPAHHDEVLRAAGWLRDWVEREGGSAQLIETGGKPLVWGEFVSPVRGAPTVLLYGHYDVQPVDPVDLWDSDPFDPVVRGDRLYARGASDMKAQVMAALSAVRALKRSGGLRVNIRLLLEGEEEVGSPNLAAAIAANADRFTADICINPDTGMLGEEIPAIRYGLRGLTYFELHLTGPGRDLHSGQYGGVVHNAAQAITEILAGLHDDTGRVTLPGFYDRVREIDGTEKSRLAAVPSSDDDLLAETGAPILWGEPEFTPTERISARPTLEINGILSGYTGAGSKTVIPSKAMAKISTRLVPDQDPDEVRDQLHRYMETSIPPSIRWSLVQLAASPPFISDVGSHAHRTLSDALEAVWGVAPVLSRSGGSVPVAAELERLVGVPSVLTGFALPADNVHSPNESQHLPTWYRGIETFIRFLSAYGEAPTAGTE